MEMFDPKGKQYKDKDQHPVDGYGKQELPGYGCEPLLQPYKREALAVANKRSRLSERR